LLADTDAVRLVSSEADGFPGLLVDRYADAAAVQALTPFADALIEDVARWLIEDLGVTTIVARHDTPVRELEGLPREVRTVRGAETLDAVSVREHGIVFHARVRTGQKTGMFLDQRANRATLARLVEPGWRVLDAFTYQGAFALHAAKRAAEVLAVDESDQALKAAEENAAANHAHNVRFEKANAFQLLRALDKAGERFDCVVLDPPAFAKNKGEVPAALRGYREINVRALRLLRPGGLLVTASCSYQVREPLFEDLLRRAAADAARTAVLVHRGGQDLDHPVLLSLPQSRYLKCFFLRVV
jgi:23S rRNA (cytosine1962-C5)-methyltransferase